MRKQLLGVGLLLWGCGSLWAGAIAPTPGALGAHRSPADYDVLRGPVLLKVFGEHAVVVGIVDDSGKDAGFIHLFRLETYSTLAPLSASLRNASVEFRGRELVIMDGPSQTFYTFSTEDAESTAPRPPAGFTGVRYVGYGLNHTIRPLADFAKKSRSARTGRIKTNEGEYVCDWPTTCFFDQDPYYDGGGGGGQPSCTHGGPGATQCSITSGGSACSVTCLSGHYACCDSTIMSIHCYCVRIGS